MTTKEQDKQLKAADYFHLMPYNWNCAQSIHKSMQVHTGLTDEQIELSYRSKGGGRAEGGLCGAIYAVRTLVGEDTPEAERLTEQFAQEARGLTCAQLKGRCGRTCAELVELAENILNDRDNRDEDEV